MNKITNYICKGRGVGALIILLTSVLLSAYYSILIRNLSTDSIPFIQFIADEILPIKMENGIIITPENTKKVYPIYTDENNNDYSFTIDTTVDKLETATLGSGLYLTKSYFYAVNNATGEIDSTKLKGNLNLEKKDYTPILQSGIKWVVICVFSFFVFSFFLLYFILNIFYAFCAGITTKTNNYVLNFDQKMRLSAICLSVIVLVSSIFELFGINLSWLTFFILVILLQILISKKLPQ